MNKIKHFKRLWSLMLLLIAMLLPQGAWASTHYDAGFGSTETTYSAAGIKFKVVYLRMYNYQGNNSHFNSNPLVTITAGGHTHTFNLGSLTGESGNSTFYYNGEGNEDPYKSGSFSKVTYEQTVDGIPVKAYFDNQKNNQYVSGSNNGGNSSKWCTADLTIEIGVQTAATVTIEGNWRDQSDGINMTESYSWLFDIPKHTCNSDIQSATNTYLKSAATCTAAAVYYESCSWCGAAQSGTFTSGSALGHNYGNGSWSWGNDGHSATCTRTCSNDANHKSSVSVTLGNGITSAQQVAPKCTSMGTTRYTATATVEGTQYSATMDVIDIAALGHSYGAGAWSWADDGHSATCTRTCGRTNCYTNTPGHTSSKSVTLGNGITSELTEAATCSKKGSHTYTATTTVENVEYSDRKEVADIDIDPLNHNYGAGSWSWEDDGHSATCTLTCSHDANHTSSKSVTLGNGITSELTEAATCSKKGSHTYTATTTVENVEYSDSKEVADIDIDPLNHNYGAGAWSWGNDGHSATCTRTCSYDANHTSSASVTLGDGIESVKLSDPTCGVQGTTRYTAMTTVEGAQYSDTKDVDDIAATGLHTFDDVTDPHHTLCTVCKHSFFRYTSSTEDVVNPNIVNELKGANGAKLDFTNTYVDGQGVMEFKGTLKTIGKDAFLNCSGFTGNLTIPNSVTSIGSWAFYKCYGFNGNLTIPNSITSIGEYAFSGCWGFIGDLTIPNSVTSIGTSAFEGCSGFTGVEFQSVPQIGSSTFNQVNCSKTVVLSDDSYVYTGENPYFPEVQSATYTRRGIKNQFGTLVVPFDVNGMGADYDLYKLDQVLDYELVLRKVDEDDNGGIVPAGTPVVFRLHDGLAGNHTLTLTASNTTVSGQLEERSEDNDFQLVGTYETIELYDSDYFISNNMFFCAYDAKTWAGGVKVAPFRAYLSHNPRSSAKAQTLSIRIADEDDDVTAVETLNAITDGTAEYYDMNGRRINSLQKGVNIVKYGNGKTLKVNIK